MNAGSLPPTVRLLNGVLVLLVIYSKGARDTIAPQILRKLAEEMGHATK